MISLPGADLAAGQAVIRHIRDGLARMRLVAGPGAIDVRVTASFGLALLDPDASVEDCIGSGRPGAAPRQGSRPQHAINWDASVTTGTRLRRLQLDDAKDSLAGMGPGPTANRA